MENVNTDSKVEVDHDFNVKIKKEVTDELMTTSDVTVLRCQPETEDHPDELSLDEMLIKQEFNEELSWEEDQEFGATKPAAEDDEEPNNQSSTSTDGEWNPKSATSHQCQICWKTFRNSRDFNRHKVIHTGERNYQCQVC